MIVELACSVSTGFFNCSKLAYNVSNESPILINGNAAPHLTRIVLPILSYYLNARSQQ